MVLRRWIAVWGLVLVACGGGGGGGGPIDSPLAPDAALHDGGPRDAGPRDAPADGAPDALPPDAPEVPVLTSVATVDGFVDARQGAEIVLELRGSGLGGVDTVQVGAFAATVELAERERVTARIAIAHGHPLGSVAVTALGAGGMSTLPAALAVTPYVVAAGAADGGRGSYAQPMHLGEPALQTAAAGDTVELLAGTHARGAVLRWPAGVTLRGAGLATTTIAPPNDESFELRIPEGAATAVTTLSEFAVAAAPDNLVFVQVGHLIATDLRIARGSVVAHAPATQVNLARVELGMVYRLDGSRTSIRDSQVRDGGGLVLGAAPTSAGHLVTLEEVTVERCASGLALLNGYDPPRAIPMTVDALRLRILDCRYPIAQSGGSLRVEQFEVRGDRGGGEPGVKVVHGELSLLNGTIADVAVGLEVQDFAAPAAHAQLSTVAITARERAVRLLGNGGALHSFTSCTLAARPEDGIALEDRRTPALPLTVSLSGTTLNGASFTGQVISGPAELLPHYRVLYPNARLAF